jgi:hypothetical protein
MRFFWMIMLAVLALSPAYGQDAALARKTRSEAILAQAGVPVLPSLPVIEDEKTSLRRTETVVAQRMIALVIVAVKGETGDHAMGHALITQFGAAGFFSPAEAAFMADPSPSDDDRTQFSWRYEDVWIMLWALSLIDDPGPPSGLADVPRLAALLRDLGTEGVLAQARLRPQGEILDAADLVYRQHWAVVDAQINGRPTPMGLDGGVIYERHYALNWLIGYLGAEWDDVSTDT